jgi:putative tryptophan/tyrosine transport system substrate-binding protein
MMKRRDFIKLLGGAAAWPLAARAQQGDRVRRVAVLVGFAEADQARQSDIPAFRDILAKLGWIEPRNLRVDLRFAGGEADRIHDYATELVRLSPDVIVTAASATTREMQRQTRTIPIVITGAGDPGASGFVKNIAHPEGNTTGITNLYASIGGKWMELLKQAVPGVERVGLIYNPELNPASGSVYIPSAEEAARLLGVKSIRLPYQDAVDLVHGIEGFAAEPNGGLIVLPPPPTTADRATIRRLAVQHRLPTIYHVRAYAAEGGLLAYGSNEVDRWRRAASFVDRILRGAKVSELPLEFPTRFQLTINLKTAKAMGLTIPETLLLTADEVIE